MLPTAADYQEALERPPGQRPIHPSLKAILNEINWAEVIPGCVPGYLLCGHGNYAAIFHLRTPSGREVVLRCMVKQVPEIAADHCNVLNDYLQRLTMSLRVFVQHQFFPGALWAADGYQPIYVMDWVDGKVLMDIVTARVEARDSAGLQELADRMAAMLWQMEQAQVAHGDLHHDNVLVTAAGELRLVDYDSVHVPPLLGRTCPIPGTSGYGHPAYFGSANPERLFGPTMDTFAGLVLLASLRAIAADLSLFNSKRRTTQNLLFHGDDLADPEQSALFRTLLTADDRETRRMAHILMRLCADRERAEQPLSSVLGLKPYRRPPPGPRIVVPALPTPPGAWTPRPPVAQLTLWDENSIRRAEAD